MQNKKSQIITNLINDGGSATFAQVVAVVEQKMLKTGNPLRNATITKLVNYNMLLNANYQNMVNNARVREGKEADFQAKENWFTQFAPQRCHASFAARNAFAKDSAISRTQNH